MRISNGVDNFKGRIIRFRDGDTVEVLMWIGWGVVIERAVRLIRIESWEPSGDTRERAQCCARECDRRWHDAHCVIHPSTRGLDCYGRIRGSILIDGQDLAAMLVTSGLAWYGKPGSTQPACIVI